VVVFPREVGGEEVGGECQGDGEAVADYVAEGDEAGVLLGGRGLVVECSLVERLVGLGRGDLLEPSCRVVGR